MTVVAKVYIVRHGETEENRRGVMQGQLDTPLNAAGVRQAALAADALADVPFGAAYSSDLQRASKTAEIILERHPGVQLQTTEALRERYMGDWQGELIATRGNPPANLEPINTFTSRSMKWWNDTIARHVQRRSALLNAGLGSRPVIGVDGEQDGREFEPVHILVVSHGGLIGTLVTNLVGSRKVAVAEGVEIGRCFNASISVVDVEESGKGVLVSYADTTHLSMEVLQENADVQ
ncbi:phosphoglycerate mutase-like protein [Trametes sanguinea]|nr:phosphoglycerate mutase-like protein [Trametes sanguinea]